MPPPQPGSLPYVTGPVVHTSTMPSEAPTATTVHPRVDVVDAPPRGRGRTALWAGVAAVTGLAIGLAAPSLLGRAGDVSPASGERVGTTIIDTEATGGMGEATDRGDMTEAAALEAAALDAEEEAEAAEREDDGAVPASEEASIRAETGTETTAPRPTPVDVGTRDAAATDAGAPAATAASRPASPAPEAGPRADDPYASSARPTTPPADPSPSIDASGERAFDRDAAASALGGAVASASACRGADDPSGVAQVTVTFAPSGRVTQATVNGPPYAGTATGGCIARAFRALTVPPFGTDPVTVTKSVTIR